jgi:GTP-binding protein EngB required for normal cell division
MLIAHGLKLAFAQEASSDSTPTGLILLGILVAIVVAFFVIRALATPDKPKPLTMLICGATGVGKSTLINTLIGTTSSKAEIGLPTTQNTFAVAAPSGEFVFYDSKGLEVQDASHTYLILMSDLLRLRFGPKAREHIDIALMCIQEPQGRIDDAHLEIAALCEDLKIPLGIVITKTLSNPELEQVIRKTFTRAEFVRRVRSLELVMRSGVVLPPEGLDLLIEDVRACVAKVHDDGKLRAQKSRGALRLAQVARWLVKEGTRNDPAWISFAAEAWVSLRMQGQKWQDLLKQQRKTVEKKLVPSFFARNFNTRFEVQKIDGAIARRIIPFIMRRFADNTSRVTDSDIAQVSTEAASFLERDRPYRARFGS